MTVRGNKRLLLVAAALVVIAGAVSVFEALRPGGEGWRGLGDAAPTLFFAVLLGSMWLRLSKLEAEHGPDYTPPATPYTRTILVVAAIAALVLGAVFVFLIARKG